MIMKYYVTFFWIAILLLLPAYLFPQLNPKWNGGITISPSPTNPGDTVTFTASLWIRNEAVTNLKVIGGVDGVTIYDNTFASLRRGALQDISFTWTATGGDHTAFFQIDPNDTIVENATDNLNETRFTVAFTSPATPLNIHFSHNSIAPVREVSGRESFVNYHIRIDEPFDSTFDVTVALRINGRQVDTSTYRFTGPGLSGERVGQFTWHTECGATVEVMIDPANAIVETNEGDNTWIHPVVCVEPYRPNLIISQYLVSWTPYFFHAGDSVTINYTSNNIGEEVCGAYKVGLKVGDRIVARASHAGHRSGVTSTGSITWTAECSGPLSLVADCDSEVIESNESDNVYQSDRFGCAVPNLKAMRFYRSREECEIEIPAYTPYVYNFHYRLENDSEVSNVRLRMGVVRGAVFYDETLSTLERIDGSVDGHISLPVGSYTLYAMIDPENTIAETNESDNRLELFVRTVGEESGDRRLPAPVFPETKNNYRITIENKKALLKSTIVHSTDVWINGLLSNTGNKSIAAANVPVRLTEENLTAHTDRVVWEETISLAPNATHKIKWRWNPSTAGKYKLTLGIISAGTDAIPNDNKDEVILKVE